MGAITMNVTGTPVYLDVEGDRLSEGGWRQSFGFERRTLVIWLARCLRATLSCWRQCAQKAQTESEGNRSVLSEHARSFQEPVLSEH
jgi:hypothetical protein